MIPELCWISEIAPLRLTQMPRPRAGDWLSDDIAGWQRAGVSTVVSMLEHQEMRELQLEEEPLLCKFYGIDYLAFPTPDAGTPRSMRDTSVLVDDLVARLRRGEGVAVHCRAGIGRSGLLSACILLRLGVAVDDVFPILTRARTLPVPDTPVQTLWVQRYAATVGK